MDISDTQNETNDATIDPADATASNGSTAFTRLAAHATTLRDTGAPHQQPLADDIERVLATDKDLGNDNNPRVASVAAELNIATAKITNLQGNVDSLMDVRDSLQDQLNAANAKIAELQTELAAKAPLGIASITGDNLTSIKAGLQGGTSTELGAIGTGGVTNDVTKKTE